MSAWADTPKECLFLVLVRSTGLEPVWLPTRPSNVRVCLFRHDRECSIQLIYSIMEAAEMQELFCLKGQIPGVSCRGSAPKPAAL